MNAKMPRWITGALGLLAIVTGSVSCGDVQTQGHSPSQLIMDSLEATSGGNPGDYSTPLLSDVRTKSTTFSDPGQVTLRIILKDQGAPGASSTPSPLNAVKITRYHVNFLRTDGRNTQGVDVPYAFDGAVTGTITTSPITLPFEMVRHQAKLEPPLTNLVGMGGRVIISTIAEVTFYGEDLAGNDIRVVGTMSVNFADFADPD
jgi:hypothetical protein